MQALVNRSTRHPLVVNTARRIVAPLGRTDVVHQWRAIRAWLAARWQFVPDPADVETVMTPPEQLARYRQDGVLRGDCDDAATLAAAFVKALGMRARFVVLGFFSPRDPYRHVYAEVQGPEGWLDFDITRGSGVHPTPVRAATVEV